MTSRFWRWALGLTYIFAVATIWIAASFVVQSVVDGGVSPFLITYICNSLFLIYIPIVEIGRYLEDNFGSIFFWRKKDFELREINESEKAILLGQGDLGGNANRLNPSRDLDERIVEEQESGIDSGLQIVENTIHVNSNVNKHGSEELDAKGRWTRMRVAKVSLAVCPFWFLAQLTFNLSLKYTSVTSNTILSSSSSLFTFLVSLAFLGETFSWLKLVSVLLCMAGTIIVSLGDSESMLSAVASQPLLGDILALASAGLYSVYITLIRKRLPDEDDDTSGTASMAQFLGFLGLFNLLIFLPVAILLNVTKLEPFNTLSWKQFGLIVGKGLLDNVLSDYLWAKAVLLTTTTVATAGLTIQVPLAAIVDTITGNAPGRMDYIGAVAVMIGFAGINIPAEYFCGSENPNLELEDSNSVSASKITVSSAHVRTEAL